MNAILTKPFPIDPNYLVSSDGNIFSLKARNYLSFVLDRKGYRSVNLSTKGEEYKYIVSRMVLITFVRLPKEGEDAHHLDRDITNNRLSNLQWVTRKENIQEQIKAGTFVFGIQNGKSKLTEEQVREIRYLYSLGLTQMELGKKFNVHFSNISLIIHRKNWKRLI